MKKIFILLLILLLYSSIAYGEKNFDSIIVEDLETYNYSQIEDLLEELLIENELTLDLNIKDFLFKIIKGEKTIDGKSFYKSISNVFLKELRIALNLFSKILAITLISTILINLQNAFEESSISQFANYITYILISILVLTSFNGIMDMAKLSLNRMVNFMQFLLPLLLSLMVIAGGPGARIVFHPLILASVNLVGLIIKSVIFPLIYFSFIVSLLSSLTKRGDLKKLSELGRQIIIFIISGAFTLFMGILTIYGISTKIDGLSIRTAKFAVDRFVPVVGGFLSEAMDTVIGSSTILKNGMGIVGLLLLVLIILNPIIKVTVFLFTYKVTAALIEPISTGGISDFFEEISKTLLMVLISMVSIGIMFFITMTIVVDTGNNLLMLR